MKEIVVGPQVAAGFPKREFPYRPHWDFEREYLGLLEDCLLLGVGEQYPVTMLSPERLRNIRDVITEVIWDGTEGDFIETGVWRGGACIYAKACLKDDNECKVFVADSFQGLPPPDPRYPADAGDRHHEKTELAISMEEVRENFRRFNLLDERVVFLKGWFDQSLPLLAPDQHFAVIRLDGDMYQSTMDAFVHLYDKLSPGGFCIVDDFGAVAACQKAVNDFRAERGITEQMFNIDGTGIFWQKNRGENE